MTDRTTALFFEIFNNDLPRQGPGDTASTLRALASVPAPGPGNRILDLGCGTGAQTLVLATHLAAKIIAIDNHAPFVAELNRRARTTGLEDRIDARV
ncbi:MAG: cyclopropane-fatty-acyl-phospholipid synthase family protein, partial [Vicinamibacterales bacterium]